MEPEASRPSPWHSGEVALQRQAGVARRLAEVGPITIRDHLIAQHRDFYPLLPMVVLGAVDGEGNAWATLRAGRPGFMQVPDPFRLHIDLTRDPADPIDGGFEDGSATGLLGIDLDTRRRNRLNGTLRHSRNGFDLMVSQSFGNCPKYIQQREVQFARDPAVLPGTAPVRATALDERARQMIAEADTFFVASFVDLEDGGRQVDVSHRGGPPGFVRIDDDGGLTIPDYAGNMYFNTLGNILVNPKAGLIFPDFTTGETLQLTGDAEILSNPPEIDAFPGARKLWRFMPRRVVRRSNALPLRWQFKGWSPSLPSAHARTA